MIIELSTSIVFGVTVPLHISQDLKGLLSSLSTPRISVDKSIRADVSVIRYEIERRFVSRIIRILGREKLADPSTKANNSLTSAQQLFMQNVSIPLSFATATKCDWDKPLG